MESLIIHGAIESEKLPDPPITYDGKDTVKKNIGILALIFSIIILAGCGLKKEVRISGKTMGTTYTIKVVTWFYEDTEDLKENIGSRLEAINQSMSTYRKDSEISRFNAFRNTRDNFHISEDFHHVMTIAEKLHALTEGAWDGTVKPLVNLWGFGASDRKNEIPEKREVKAMLADIGFDLIRISESLYLKKKKATVSLNLASIAKGYAVDEVAAIIQAKGVKPEALVFSFVNSLTCLSAEMEGRHYGGGVLELVPSEIERLLIPIVEANSALLKAADQKYRESVNDIEFLSMRDSYVLGKIGLSGAEQTCLHEAWLKLRNRRQRLPE